MDFLFIAFAVLQGLDAYTTIQVIKHGGHERNTLLSSAMNHFGVVPSLIVVKCCVLVVTRLYLMDIAMLGMLCAFYILVVWHNIIVLRYELNGQSIDASGHD